MFDSLGLLHLWNPVLGGSHVLVVSLVILISNLLIMMYYLTKAVKGLPSLLLKHVPDFISYCL